MSNKTTQDNVYQTKQWIDKRNALAERKQRKREQKRSEGERLGKQQ